MNIISQLCNDELLYKWFKYYYSYRTGMVCDTASIMVSNLRNIGLSDNDILKHSKSYYTTGRKVA